MKPNVLRKIKKTITDRVAKELVLSATTGYNVVDEVCAPRFFQHGGQGGDLSASTSYGLLDVRICIEGCEVIYGVPMKDIEGATITEKLGVVTAMAAESFHNLAKGTGFVYVATKGSGIVIPHGFMLAFTNPDPAAAHGIRWQLLGSAKTKEATLNFLEGLIIEYPSYERAPHGAVLEVLRNVD